MKETPDYICMMRTCQSERLAAETTANRDARLQQISALQHERLAAESAAERDIRLQQMSALQRERLAAESTTERDTRLQRMRDRLAAETTEEKIRGWSVTEQDTGTTDCSVTASSASTVFHPSQDT